MIKGLLGVTPYTRGEVTVFHLGIWRQYGCLGKLSVEVYLRRMEVKVRELEKDSAEAPCQVHNQKCSFSTPSFTQIQLTFGRLIPFYDLSYRIFIASSGNIIVTSAIPTIMKAYTSVVIANSLSLMSPSRKEIWHTGSDAPDVTGSSNSALFRIIRVDETQWMNT